MCEVGTGNVEMPASMGFEVGRVEQRAQVAESTRQLIWFKWAIVGSEKSNLENPEQGWRYEGLRQGSQWNCL